MSLRASLKVPKYGLFYFKSDRTTSIVSLNKIVKVISGDKKSNGSKVELNYGGVTLEAEIIGVNDDTSQLRTLEGKFLNDPANSWLFEEPESDTEHNQEYEQEPAPRKIKPQPNKKVAKKPVNDEVSAELKKNKKRKKEPELVLSKEVQRDNDTPIASDPESVVGPGCMNLINTIVPLKKGYSDISIEIKDSPGPSQSSPNDISGTSTSNISHFKETDSVSSLDDLQDVEMFDHESDTLDNLTTKSDIMRVEMQQEVILANQQAILDRLDGISRLLNEKAKKKGISPVECHSNASGSHSGVSVTTSTVNTKATKLILPALSSANEQEASTSGKAKSAKMLQPLFPPKKATNADDDSGEEPTAPSTSTLTADDVVVKENKLLLKDIRDMVGNAYSREELAESSVEGGKRKYRGVEFVKNALSPARLNKIMKSAQKKHPQAFARLNNTGELREAINMKCRKTVKGKSLPK